MADITKPAVGSSNWNVAVDALIDDHNVNDDLLDNLTKVHVVGDSGASLTLDASSASGSTKILTLTDDAEITLTASSAGASIDLFIKQDGNGNRVPVWVTLIKWDGGIAPTFSSGPNATDRVALFYDGSYWYGNLVGRSYA